MFITQGLIYATMDVTLENTIILNPKNANYAQITVTIATLSISV